MMRNSQIKIKRKAFYCFTFIVLGIVLSNIVSTAVALDSPPNKPTTLPVGPSLTYPGINNWYKFTAFDINTAPDGNVVYHVDWGDNSPLESTYVFNGDTITLYHRFQATGVYNVRFSIENSLGFPYRSPYSDPLVVNVNNFPRPGSSASVYQGQTANFYFGVLDVNMVTILFPL